MQRFLLAAELTALWLAWEAVTLAAPAEAVKLASAGQAELPIVVARGASNQVALAKELAGWLRRISGASFEVRAVDQLPEGGSIVVATASQFPELQLAEALPLADVADREHYVVRTTGGRLLLVGTTDLATQHAVYRLLEWLGCRWFLPSDHWEIIPRAPELSVAVELDERPHFLTREFVPNGSRHWGMGGVVERWKKRNRLANSLQVAAGDGAYGRFLAKNPDLVGKHPEFLALVNGQRTRHGNFCISNPQLRDQFTIHVLEQFRARPTLDMVSVGPDDTPVWCECEPCRALGSPTDRMVLLANQVVAAVAAEFPGKTVGMYAYSAAAAPPTVPVDPRIFVPVTTRFIQQPHDELLAVWRRQGAQVGVREYSSVYIWDFGLPWKNARAANLAYWQEKIPHWHRNFGVQVFTTETVNHGGLFGLGNYVLLKLLWDVNTDVAAVVDDFLVKCFGRAAPTMRTYYDLIGGANRDQPSDDYLGRLYRCLAAARQQEDDPGVRARLNDLTLYLRYVNYFAAYDEALNFPPPDRTPELRAQPEFEQMLRFTWKIRATGMVDTYQNWRWLQRFGGFAWPEGESMSIVMDRLRKAKADRQPLAKAEQAKMVGLAWNVPEGKHPWKESGTFTSQEIEMINAWGVQQHPLLGIEPVSFSRNLVPVPFAPDPARADVMQANRGGVMQLYLWKEADAPLPPLILNCGFVYGKGPPLPWKLYDAADRLVESGEVPTFDKNDRTEHTITFRVTTPGLYRFEWADRGVGTYLRWAPGAKVCYAASPDFPSRFNYGVAGTAAGKGRLFFYVPRHTEQVVLYRNSATTNSWQFHDATGQPVEPLGRAPRRGHLILPVRPAQRGTVWSASHVYGHQIQFLTIPPVWALSPAELLLPREVLATDGWPTPPDHSSPPPPSP